MCSFVIMAASCTGSAGHASLLFGDRGGLSFCRPGVAALRGALVFGILPDAVSVTGAAVILSGGLILAWREARLPRAAQPE